MAYDIGEVLKKCRNNTKMSVKQISDVLTQKGYKASESTIYSWENGNSQPTPGALLIMCQEYGVTDVLSTFGYDGYNEDGSIQLNLKEIDHIEKYRSLDTHGKEMVDFTLQKEWERSTADAQDKDYLLPRAAHNDYINEPDELEKMRDDLSNLKRPNADR